MIDATHDPALRSWVESANRSDADFPIQNLPYGTFVHKRKAVVRLGIAIGDMILDVGAAFQIPSMENLMALPQAQRVELRRQASQFLSEYSQEAEHLLTPM